MIHDIDPKIKFITVDSAKQGLKLLPTLPKPPDLIFLDLALPGMDGFEFLQRLKKSKTYTDYKDIPVVTLATYINEPEKCYELGACLAITKPNSIKYYRGLLAEVLKHDIAKDCVELRELVTTK
jgi:CheY-like chemotaxis protein